MLSAAQEVSVSGEVVDLLHAADQLRDRRALRPDHDGVDAGGLHLAELRGHVGVADAEALDRRRLDALQLGDLLHVLQAALAVAGGLGHQADDLGRGGVLLDVGHQRGDLLAVDHRDAEHVVVGARAHRLGDVGARADVAEHRNLLLVGDVLPGHRVAGVRRAEHGDDLFVVDQVAHVLDRLRRLRGVVTRDRASASCRARRRRH